MSGRTEGAADHVEADVGLGRYTSWLEEASNRKWASIQRAPREAGE